MPAADSTLSRPMAVADSTSPRPVPPEILHNNNPQPGHNMPHYWPQGTASLPPHVTVSEQFMRRMETVVSRAENISNASRQHISIMSQRVGTVLDSFEDSVLYLNR